MAAGASGTVGTVKLAFVGTGGIAQTHAGALKALGDRARVVAAADTQADALGRFAEGEDLARFDNATALMDAIAAGSVDVDGVVVCTPPNVRTQVVEGALNAGVGVLIEKPLASTGPEARSLAQSAANHPDVVAAVGYCHRFTPAVIAMKKLVEEGRIGQLARFENVFAFHHPPMSERWFSDPAVSGGGSFIDTGCHSLDLFQFLVGTPRVAGGVFHNPWQGRGDASASIIVRAEAGTHQGVAGVILSGWLEPARFWVRLVGTDGALFYDYEKPTEIFHTAPDGNVNLLEVETHDVRFERQLAAFVDAVAEGKTAAEVGLATLEHGARVAEAVDEAHNSCSL